MSLSSANLHLPPVGLGRVASFGKTICLASLLFLALPAPFLVAERFLYEETIYSLPEPVSTSDLPRQTDDWKLEIRKRVQADKKVARVEILQGNDIVTESWIVKGYVVDLRTGKPPRVRRLMEVAGALPVEPQKRYEWLNQTQPKSQGKFNRFQKGDTYVWAESETGRVVMSVTGNQLTEFIYPNQQLGPLRLPQSIKQALRQYLLWEKKIKERGKMPTED